MAVPRIKEEKISIGREEAQNLLFQFSNDVNLVNASETFHDRFIRLKPNIYKAKIRWAQYGSAKDAIFVFRVDALMEDEYLRIRRDFSAVSAD